MQLMGNSGSQKVDKSSILSSSETIAGAQSGAITLGGTSERISHGMASQKSGNLAGRESKASQLKKKMLLGPEKTIMEGDESESPDSDEGDDVLRRPLNSEYSNMIPERSSGEEESSGVHDGDRTLSAVSPQFRTVSKASGESAQNKLTGVSMQKASEESKRVNQSIKSKASPITH